MPGVTLRSCLAAAAGLPLALSCSYVEVPFPAGGGKSGDQYAIGRTMELNNILGKTTYSVEVVPASVHGGKYAYVAPMNVFGIPILGNEKVPFDGMNEAGLTISALALEASEYEQHSANETAIVEVAVVPTLLAACDTVDCAIDYLSKVRVVATPSGPVKMIVGLHWAIADATGRSIAVEYLKGERVVYENTPRVFTNDPPLPWHWTHLSHFPTVTFGYPNSNDDLAVQTSEGPVPHTSGYGWNLFGLPGDASPPSRFVRMFFQRGYALKQQAMRSFEDAVVLINGLLNGVYKPFGAVAAMPGPLGGPEFTPYAVVKHPVDRKYIFRGYRNSQWRMIDLTKLDMTKVHAWPLEDGTLGMADITNAATVTEAVI